MHTCHSFFDEEVEVTIPAGTTLLAFGIHETQLLRNVLGYIELIDNDHNGRFTELLIQLDQEENVQ